MANRYVNTASTSGGDGTTNATSGANRAWADLAEAANGLGASLSAPIDLYCEGSAADTSNVNQTVWDMTTTATNKLRIIGEQSPLHPNFSTSKSGIYDTSLYHITCTNRNGLYNNLPDHIEFHGLQVHVTVSDASSYVAFKTTNANQTATDIACVMAHCIAKATRTSGSVIGFNTRFPGTGGRGTSKVYNCLSIDCSTGFNNDFGLSGDVGEYYNCTAADSTFGFVEDATMKVINCLSKGATSVGFVGTFASGSNYNAEDDGNGAPGANSRSLVTFTFVNAAADDFHLASSDAGAKGYGTADPGSGAFSDDCDGFARGAVWDIGFDEYPLLLEQEGFRWGVDDGSESAYTWEANQDTSISIADTQARLLRVLVNATGDPAATAYTLLAQKNGSGGYTKVNVGATTDITPVIEAGDCTESGNNTATTSWAVSYPAYVNGDLLIFHVASDADVTHDWPATGPNGETITTLIDSTGGTAQRASGFYFVGSATTGAGSITVTPSASEQWTAVVLKVPAGEFYATTPIQATVGSANDTTADANWATPAWTAASRANGKVVCFAAIDTVTTANATSGWTALIQRDRGAVGCSLVCRDAANSASESIASADIALVSSETDSSFGYVINAPTITNEVYIDASANITAGGEATTARLTAPSGKTTGDFVTGRRWDDENGTDTIDVTTDDYTEVEWKVALSSTPVANDYYDFRVYAGATNALDTYTQLPRWTIPSAGGANPKGPLSNPLAGPFGGPI